MERGDVYPSTVLLRPIVHDFGKKNYAEMAEIFVLIYSKANNKNNFFFGCDNDVNDWS
jgi:hypothetical protein